MKYLFLLLLSHGIFAQSFNFANSAKAGGTGADTNVPGVILTYADAVVFGAITPTITITKAPITGLDATDFTVSNCVASSVTQVGVSPSNTYTVTITPTNDGAFTFSIGANKFIDIGGRNNTASNTMSIIYIKDVAVHNIQLATITKSEHWMGLDATFSEDSDIGTTDSGEMLCWEYNIGATSFYGSATQAATDIHSAGRVSMGAYINCAVANAPLGTYPTVNAAITSDRGGSQPPAMSYKNGNTYCKTTFKTYFLVARNSSSEFQGTNEYRYSTSLTDDDMIDRSSTFRLDYYTPGTNSVGTITPNWAGAKTYLDGNISTIVSSNGWFTSFHHWPYDYKDYSPRYFGYLYDTLLAGQSVARIPFDKGGEYLWTKSAVDSIKATSRTITVYHHKKYSGSPYDRITTPLCMLLDLSATNYAGTGIAVVFGGTGGGQARSLGSDRYIVTAMLNFNNPSTAFDIVNTSSPTYVNLTRPTATLSGNTLTTDQLCKVALWSIPISSVGSSSSSVAIPTTHPTLVSATVSTGLSIVNGSMIKLYNNSTHYICGKVISYNSGSGALSFRSLGNVGTGTLSSWTLYAGGYEIEATLVERQNTTSTSHVLATTLTPTTKYYQVGYISDPDRESATKHF